MSAQQEIGWGSRSMELDLAFSEFHAENPEVYALFLRFTHQAAAAGYDHYSARAIAHRIRWHSNVKKGNRDFKLNNNLVRRYALKLMRDHPQYTGFFKTRNPVEE